MDDFDEADEMNEEDLQELNDKFAQINLKVSLKINPLQIRGALSILRLKMTDNLINYRNSCKRA